MLSVSRLSLTEISAHRKGDGEPSGMKDRRKMEGEKEEQTGIQGEELREYC